MQDNIPSDSSQPTHPHYQPSNYNYDKRRAELYGKKKRSPHIINPAKRPSIRELQAEITKIENTLAKAQFKPHHHETEEEHNTRVDNIRRDLTNRKASILKYLNQFSSIAMRCSLPKKKQREMGILPPVGDSFIQCPECEGKGEKILDSETKITCDICVGKGKVLESKIVQLLNERLNSKEDFSTSINEN